MWGPSRERAREREREKEDNHTKMCFYFALLTSISMNDRWTGGEENRWLTIKHLYTIEQRKKEGEKAR